MNLPLPPILVPALLAAVCWMLALITMVRVWPWSWPAHRDRVVSGLLWLALGCALLLSAVGLAIRSEEHTSELQSLMRISYAVFCLTKKNPLIHTLTIFIAM